MSLNNRIYFRDQVSGSSGDADTSRLTVTSRVRATGMGSIHYTTGRGEAQLRTPLEVFKLETTTTTRDLENAKGDSASLNSDPRQVLFNFQPLSNPTLQDLAIPQEIRCTSKQPRVSRRPLLMVESKTRIYRWEVDVLGCKAVVRCGFVYPAHDCLLYGDGPQFRPVFRLT